MKSMFRRPSVLLGQLCLFFAIVGLAGCSCEGDGLLLYGLQSRQDGCGMLQVVDGRLHVVAQANELRPDTIKEDWSRKFASLRAIAIRDNRLFYYVPGLSGVEGAVESPGSIYEKQLNSTLSPKRLLTVPRLTSICREPKSLRVFATTDQKHIVALDLKDRSIRRLGIEEGVSFVSWDSKAGSLVGVHQSDIWVIHPGSGRVLRTYNLGNTRIDRAFSIDGGAHYVIQSRYQARFFDPLSETVVPPFLPLVSALFCDEAGLVYLVPNDSDGRTLWAIDPREKSSRGKQIAHGVFDDWLARN